MPRSISVGAPDYTLPPIRTAVIAQFLGALIAVGLLALLWPGALERPLIVAFAQGLAAAFTSYKLEAPPWWHGIHLGFMPLVVVANKVAISPVWYLIAFLMMALVFWRVALNRVPLFLSSQQAISAVATLMPRRPCIVIDLGCGNAKVIHGLAKLRPDCSFIGIEHAPLPWLWARARCRSLSNCMILMKDIWKYPLTEADIVFAFLSPVPMQALWEKAEKEMQDGALLISNTFEIPGQVAEQIIDVPDKRASRLYCYRVRSPNPKGVQLGP